MATVRKEILTRATSDQAWDAIRDVGALHTRLVPGFVIDTKLDGNVRAVTFSNGQTVKEPIISIEEDHRRVVWTSIGGRLSHYNSALQVFDHPGGCRIMWLSDLLPSELEGAIQLMMDQGAATMKRTLDSLAEE